MVPKLLRCKGFKILFFNPKLYLSGYPLKPVFKQLHLSHLSLPINPLTEKPQAITYALVQAQKLAPCLTSRSDFAVYYAIVV